MFPGFKTVIFNFVWGGLTIWRAVSPELEVVDEETIKTGVDTVLVGMEIIWAAGNFVLRAFTKTPIFKKE